MTSPGYTLGAAGFFPGDALVNRSAGNLIYVSIQYRLGAFGFLVQLSFEYPSTVRLLLN